MIQAEVSIRLVPLKVEYIEKRQCCFGNISGPFLRRIRSCSRFYVLAGAVVPLLRISDSRCLEWWLCKCVHFISGCIMATPRMMALLDGSLILCVWSCGWLCTLSRVTAPRSYRSSICEGPPGKKGFTTGNGRDMPQSPD